MTPAGGIPIGVTSGPFGMLQVYPNKASEFMFKQFEGFKDFTMNTAKSGLSAGEKTAFWMYGKVRTWSRKWFTHIFLFLVVMAYSVIGRSGNRGGGDTFFWSSPPNFCVPLSPPPHVPHA
jgi:hypothetical protein